MRLALPAVAAAWAVQAERRGHSVCTYRVAQVQHGQVAGHAKVGPGAQLRMQVAVLPCKVKRARNSRRGWSGWLWASAETTCWLQALKSKGTVAARQEGALLGPSVRELRSAAHSLAGMLMGDWLWPPQVQPHSLSCNTPAMGSPRVRG